MGEARRLKVQLLTQETFQAFGTIIGQPRRDPDFRGASGMQLWDLDCEIDGRLQLGLIRVPYQPLRFRLMEQHHGVMQSFIHMGGAPAVVGLVPPTPRGEVPKPEDVTAFLIRPGQGYILARNTWHALDRFPLYPPAGNWVILTDRETTADLKASGPGQGGDKLTQTINFEQLYDIAFEFDLDHIEAQAAGETLHDRRV